MIQYKDTVITSNNRVTITLWLKKKLAKYQVLKYYFAILSSNSKMADTHTCLIKKIINKCQSNFPRISKAGKKTFLILSGESLKSQRKI